MSIIDTLQRTEGSWYDAGDYVRVVSSPHISYAEQKVIEWRHGSASGFITALMELLCVADLGNRDRIAKGFPELVEAWRDWHNGTLDKKVERIVHDLHAKEKNGAGPA